MATRQSEAKGGFSLDSLRIPLIGFGVFALFAGLITNLIGGLPSIWNGITLSQILLAAGILLLGIYVAIDPEDVWSKVTGRGALYSGNALLIGAAALVILGLFNVLGSRYETKVDLTANKQFSLSDQSVKVVQALPDTVHVTAWLLSSDSRKQDFQTLLGNYSIKSGGKLTYEFIDPETRPADARAAGITATGTVVYQLADKKQQSTGTTESDVSTALVKLERPNKKIYFTTGHGERSFDDVQQTGYSSIKQALERDNYTTAELTLVTTHAVPDDAAEVVIAGPTNPFLQDEKDALKAYLDGGGKLIVMMGPGTKTDLNDILGQYQVGFNGNDVIVDPIMSAQQDPRFIAVNSFTSHAITKDLTGTLAFFPYSTSINAPSGQQATGITVLAQSSNQSWGSSSLQQLQQRQDSDPKGPLPLMVAVDTGASSSGSTPASGNHARLVLIGTPDLIANYFVQQVPSNEALFLDTADWVAEQENVIDIRPPDTTPHQLSLIGWQMNLIGVVSAILLPLAILAAGASVWWTRR